MTWLRWVFRAPRRLYDVGWGGLLGHRFLLLRHTGRRTGRPRAVVLEVLRYDRATGEHVVVSGFGPRADWLRNLEAGGPAAVRVGRSTFAVRHQVLDPDTAVAVLAEYERRNRFARPVLRRVLSLLLGWPYRGTDADRRRAVAVLPLVALRPATTGGPRPR
jgi:deazaflavin-dependent oxidoreductase (nitroreductase family)